MLNTFQIECNIRIFTRISNWLQQGHPFVATVQTKLNWTELSRQCNQSKTTIGCTLLWLRGNGIGCRACAPFEQEFNGFSECDSSFVIEWMLAFFKSKRTFFTALFHIERQRKIPIIKLFAVITFSHLFPSYRKKMLYKNSWWYMYENGQISQNISSNIFHRNAGQEREISDLFWKCIALKSVVAVLMLQQCWKFQQ